MSTYPAGDQVRSLITDATAQLATVPAAVNVGHPGQMSFLDGVTTKFSGHEPDAQTTNLQTWIKEAFSGPDPNLWYHPNDAGQTAYAELLLARGTWGATPSSATTPTATFRVRATKYRVPQGRPVTLRVRVRLSDSTVPSSRLVVRERGRRQVLVRRTMRMAADGHVRLPVRGLAPGRRTLVVTYRDKLAPRVRDRVRVRIVR